MLCQLSETKSLPIADCQLPIEAADSNKSVIGNWQSAIPFIVSLAVIVPAVVWGIPSNLDLTNHFRFALPFHDAIVAGNLYPGWLAESNGGYGDPSFRFYPPALYYLLAASRFLIGNWYGATLAVFVILSITAGLGMFFWTRSILPSQSAIWASFFYALAPYHLNQLYQATLLAEWAASAVLPFLFGFVERVCQRGKARDIAGLAASFGILVFTHLPLTVIGSLALLAYALVRIEGPDKVRKLAKLSLAAVLGLSVSAVYWVTMISEIRWIRVNDIQPIASADYRHNFIFSTLSTDNLSVWWMNILALMTLLLFAPALLLLFKAGAPLRRGMRPVVVLVALALFMSVPLSRPIWTLLKPLQETQFPWRWMILISLGGSILAAAGLPLLSGAIENLDRAKRMVVFGAMAISVAFTLSHVVREAQYFPPQKFENMLTAVRGTPSVNYWIPIWSGAPVRTMTTEVEVADRLVSVNSWQPEHRRFSVTAGPATEARVRTFYYPHWTARSETGTLTTRPDKDGALLISLPPDATSVALDFREPRKSNFSTTASLGGLIVIGTLAAPFRRRRKHD
jgi:hypothetical protein